jgi:hypothetical protein
LRIIKLSHHGHGALNGKERERIIIKIGYDEVKYTASGSSRRLINKKNNAVKP